MGRTPLAERATVAVHIGRFIVYRNGGDPIEIVRGRTVAAAPARRLDLPLAVRSR